MVRWGQSLHYSQMPQEITKEQILTAIVSRYFGDIDFIEKVNDITFHQKRKLQAIKGGKLHHSPPNNAKN